MGQRFKWRRTKQNVGAILGRIMKGWDSFGLCDKDVQVDQRDASIKNLETTLKWFYLWLIMGFPGSASGKESVCQCRKCKRDERLILDRKDPLEKEMATYSSILAWEILWIEQLRSCGCERVRHNLATKQQHQILPTSFSVQC